MRRSFLFAGLPAAALLALAGCSETAGNGAAAGGGGAGGGAGAHRGPSGNGGHDTSSSAHSTSSSSSGHGTSSSSGNAQSSSVASSSSGGGTSGTSSTLFTASNPWNTPVDADPKSPSSDAIIGWLSSNGGWGAGSMMIDFSINLLTADASTPFLTFDPTGDFYSPDCDNVPFPVPQSGAVEGEQGYACTQGGDCHLLVVHPPSHKLYEMWRADIEGSTFNGGCVAVWDLTKSYPPNLRGDGCTSADAGGFPIAAMLFSADEVYAGEIAHAIRFILPNERIRHDTYVHPGSHTTSATSGAANAPPYGVRFRLRADFPLTSLPSDGARVVARALQKYGMFLADGGNIALTAADDGFTQHKWTDVAVDSHSLTGIQVSDMEVVDMGTPMTTMDCTRNP